MNPHLPGNREQIKKTAPKCIGLGEFWFSPAKKDKAQARLICLECPITKSCLETAFLGELASSSKYTNGIAGGFTAGHRKRMIRMCMGSLMPGSNLLSIIHYLKHSQPELKVGSDKWWFALQKKVDQQSGEQVYLLDEENTAICPSCGVRTDLITQDKKTHKHKCPACGLIFIGVFDG